MSGFESPGQPQTAGAAEELPQRTFAPPPAFGPAPPATGGRASFGVSAGPIGGYRPGYGPQDAIPAGGGSKKSKGKPRKDEVGPGGEQSQNAYGMGGLRPGETPVSGHTGELFLGPGREIKPHRATKHNTGGHATVKPPATQQPPATDRNLAADRKPGADRNPGGGADERAGFAKPQAFVPAPGFVAGGAGMGGHGPNGPHGSEGTHGKAAHGKAARGKAARQEAARIKAAQKAAQKAGRQIGQHPPAGMSGAGAGIPGAAGDAAGQKRSLPVTIAAFGLGAIVLFGAVAGGMMYFSGGDRPLNKVLELGSGGATESRVATAPLDGRTTAGFEMIAASHQVSVTTQDLGDSLYKITTAEDSGMLPSPAVKADRVQLLLSPKGTGGTGDVTVVLSSKVRWSLTFTGGSDEQLIDLTGGRVSDVSLTGGARRVELTLPKPTGTVPVHVTGGLDELSVKSPADAPVRVNVQAGAKTVAAGTRTLRDVAPGSTLTPKDWQVKNRYDVDAKGWVSLLSVDAKG